MKTSHDGFDKEWVIPIGYKPTLSLPTFSAGVHNAEARPLHSRDHHKTSRRPTEHGQRDRERNERCSVEGKAASSNSSSSRQRRSGQRARAPPADLSCVSHQSSRSPSLFALLRLLSLYLYLFPPFPPGDGERELPGPKRGRILVAF